MKINNIEVTKEDFKRLLDIIKNTRKQLAEGEVYNADKTLEILEENLVKNLREDTKNEL